MIHSLSYVIVIFSVGLEIQPVSPVHGLNLCSINNSSFMKLRYKERKENQQYTQGCYKCGLGGRGGVSIFWMPLCNQFVQALENIWWLISHEFQFSEGEDLGTVLAACAGKQVKESTSSDLAMKHPLGEYSIKIALYQ